MKVSVKGIFEARERIRDRVHVTPLEPASGLVSRGGAEVRLKWESLQIWGSFKARGAFNRILSLSSEARRRGVIVSTAGNHGVAMAAAARELGTPVRVLVPRWIDPHKRRLIERSGPTVECFESVEEAREEAKRIAERDGLTFVSAYNDVSMIEGGGTLGIEVLEQWPECDTLVVGVGGGGLASGVCLAAKARNPKVRICGVQAAASPLMAHWLRQKKILPTPLGPTLAEGLAVNMEPDTLTFPLLLEHLDEMVLVTEEEIEMAMVWALAEQQRVVEGAGAATIAALAKLELPSGARVAGIVTGGIISLERYYAVLKRRLG